MSDFIGRIPVPAALAVAHFPLRTDYAHGQARKRNVVVHQFGGTTGKVEQRFYVGPSANRYTFRRTSLTFSNRRALAAFWESQLGPQGAFFYDVPEEDGSFSTKTVCFEDAPLTFEDLAGAVSTVGITFVEIPDATDAPVYPLNATVTRFPVGTLADSLLDQTQEIIPLVRIRVPETAVDDIFLSDRRVSVGAQLYLPRLLHLGDPGSDALITQTIEGSSDDVQFTFGNADRVMIKLANDTELKKSHIELSLYFVATGTKLDLWAGEIVDWASDQGPEFSVQASDIISALTLQSPVGNISRTCWRIYADPAYGCTVNKAVDTRDLVHFPNSTMDSCDLGYETPNGCLAHVVAKQSFPGCAVKPQAVTIKDNSTGGLFGFGRDLITPTSQINDSIYNGTLPEIWHNDDGIPQRGLPVQCRVADGREESDFYDALGIVGRGPIGAYTVARMYDSDGDGKAETFIGSTLDGQPHHGFRQTDSSGSYTDSSFGLRQSIGNDPNPDYFSLGRVAGTPTSWREIVGGSSVFEENYAAGVAFMEIRRTDQKGVQPSEISSHQMTAMVSRGLAGFVWNSAGTRSQVGGITNLFWVAVNTLLRSLGVQGASAAEQEAYFDVDAAVACAAIADASVPAIFGAGNETQFRFKGTLDTRKPLRDRLQEILNNGLGFYTWSFGKLRLGCRNSPNPATYFSAGNMLFGSLKLEPLKPQFEKLTVEFADEEYLFQKNTIDYTDQDYALRNNRVQNPRASQLGLIGSATKSQASRIAVMRTREELGGVGLAEQTQARVATWRSTVLALDTEAGQVIGLEDPDVPGGAGLFRIESWRLNRDWSLDFKAKSIGASTYDMSTGSVAVDVKVVKQPTQADIDQGPPPEPIFLAQVAPDDPSSAEVYSLSFASTVNTRTIIQGTFTFTFHDPATPLVILTKVFSTAFPYEFFAFPYSASELAWVLKAHLPGMNVTQIAGYVTNVYGDSTVYTLAVDLRLAGSPKSFEAIDHEFLYAYDATTGTFSARQVLDDDIGFSDITTGNSSTSEHGFLLKLSGSVTDVLRGDGTWGPDAGDPGLFNFADRITPSGAMDGTNAVFTLPETPNPPESLIVWRNGVGQLWPGVDYDLSGFTFTMLSTDNLPDEATGEFLRAWFRY